MVCTDLDLLNMLRLLRIVVNMITIIVPAILVLFVILDIIKTTSSGDVDTKKLFKAISKRVVAALMIFLVPHIINISFSFFTDKSYYLNCYDNAKSDYILEASESLAITAMNEAESDCVDNSNYASYEKARKAVSKISDKSVRKSYETRLSNIRKSCEKGQSTGSNGGSSNSGTISSKTIWVGDSRVLGICQAKNMCGSGDSCYNDSCIAATGEDYSWFHNTAIDEVKTIIKNNPSTNYTVYINIGVNGVGKDGKNASSFASDLLMLNQKDLPTTKIIFISLNPVTDGESNAYNSGITEFNTKIQNNIKNANSSNLKYCNTNSTLRPIPSSDGLHFSNETNLKIYDHVIKNCK